MKQLVSLQILNWNRASDSIRAIESAKNQTYKNIEIVFIDNGSTDNSLELVKKLHPDITVISLDKNYGCPGGRNKGIPYCNGDYIFYLDNDGVLHEQAVERAMEIILKHPDVGILTGKVYDFDSPTEIDTSIKPKSNAVYYFNNFQGGICLHKKSIYEKIGNYPDHFMYGGEEWFMTCKALDNDIKIVKDEAVILWHKRSDLARDRTNELLRAYYNKLYVCIALYPIKYAIQFALYFPFIYYRYAKNEKIQNAFRSTFIMRYFQTVSSALRNRNPIKVKTYRTLFSK